MELARLRESVHGTIFEGGSRQEEAGRTVLLRYLATQIAHLTYAKQQEKAYAHMHVEREHAEVGAFALVCCPT